MACGPGAFSIYISKKVNETRGVDISDKEIYLAIKSAIEFGLENVNFDCADVESLPYSNNCFSVVVCKSAFHHFINADIVLKEMKRCCLPGGKICMQDIVAFDDSYVTNFFESFDKLVDISHHRVLSISDFDQLYQNNLITKVKVSQFEAELNADEYIKHAVQEPENITKIKNLIYTGLKDKRLSEYLFTKNGEIYFKRVGYQILGENEVSICTPI